MEPIDAATIRSSFVNCSQGEAKRAPLPPLEEVRWEVLDFLGWTDPSGSQRAYLVLAGPDGPLGLVARQTPLQARGGARSSLCQVCLTPHTGSGVALTVAPKAGPAGRKGDTTGIYLCRDLACSLYVRGLKVPSAPRLRETLEQDAMVARLVLNLEEFVARVLR